MAVEKRRGCGYRKVGGLYLVSGGAGVACDRLPIRLDVCPVCNSGFKHTRGWTWVDVPGLVGGDHTNPMFGLAGQDRFPCGCHRLCPLCKNVKSIGRAGLLWIGEKYYPTWQVFEQEGVEMGLSRRISAIPRNFKVGETWVMLAHPKVVKCEHCGGDGVVVSMAPSQDPSPAEPCSQCKGQKFLPAAFKLWRPSRIEQIFKESDRESAEVSEAIKKGITPVFVPDDDPDHNPKATADDEEEAAVPEKIEAT